MSDLQRDIERLEMAVMTDCSTAAWETWLRLKPRLTPDRDRVRAAIEVATEAYRADTKDRRSLLDVITDAAIDAMKETP